MFLYGRFIFYLSIFIIIIYYSFPDDMEGEDVIYSRQIQAKTENGQYKNKKIIILLTMKVKNM